MKLNSSRKAYPQLWIRLPPKGHCPHSGLTRSAFYPLINEGKIRSVAMKKPGTIRGTRLIWLPSVLELLDRLADAQQKQEADHAE
jgi:hypothetical protein